MRPFRAILAYFALVFLGGALLAPWIYFFVRWAGARFGAGDQWAAIPFSRFVDRSFIAMAILGLPCFLRGLGRREPGEFQAAFHRPALGGLVAGASVGFISLACALGGELAAGARIWRGGHSTGEIARCVLSATATAVAVAFLEEILFRWALFGSLRKVTSLGAALWGSSAIYALVHFFSRPESPANVVWWSGLALLPRMLRGFADWHALTPGFLNLLLVGVILARAFDWTKRLWFSIGLHGGWIFWLKTFGFWTALASPKGTWFWGGEKVIDGWVSTIILICVACIVNVALKNGESRQKRSES